MNTQSVEVTSKLRIIEDYKTRLSQNLGVKEKCIWHDISDFHVYNNLTCDLMHDLYEGVCRYDMANIRVISKLVSSKYF